MLKLRSPLSTRLSEFIACQFFLQIQQLRAKSSFRCRTVGDAGDEERFDSWSSKENERSQLRLYKSRGQHILTNQRVLDAIVRSSGVKSTDTVLEIGPGTGNLTQKLLEAANRVVAIEIDRRMVEILHRRASQCGLEGKLKVICDDALKTEFSNFDLVVSNIPFGISSPLVAKLVFGKTPFRSATLLLQKEFAKRLMANPGDPEFNRLAANVKLMAKVEFVANVSKKDFVPCPKVDSSVVKIHPKAGPPDIDLQEWWAFTRTCFSKKNKTLGAIFKQKKKVVELLNLSEATGIREDGPERFYGCNSGNDMDEEDDLGKMGCSEMGATSFRDKVVEVLKSGGFEDKRTSKLPIEELMHLLSLFNRAGIRFHNRTTPRSSSEFAAS